MPLFVTVFTKPTAGLPELSFETGAGHLEFANHVFAELVGNAGASDLLRKKSVVIVAAVYRVVVEISGNAVEADHAESRHRSLPLG